MTTAAVCRGCSRPTQAGRAWHSECKDTVRASADARTETLDRDGAHCVRCPQWWNHLALTFLHPPAACPDVCPDCRRVHAGLLGVQRRVDVDHTDPLGGPTGTHDPTNWQVLCRRHHKRKTQRVDMPLIRGRRPKPSQWRILGVGLLLTLTALAALLLWRGAQSEGWPVLELAAALVVLALLVLVVIRRRKAVIRRLWEALAPKLGASNTARRPIRRVRWRWERRRLGWRMVPRSFELRYPHTVDDGDPDVQLQIERRVQAKLGSTWSPRWHTTEDRVVFRSPDPLAEGTSSPWPHRGAERLSLWDPIPVGVAEDGSTVDLRMPGKNLLMGGEPEAGKSRSLQLIVATGALDTDTILHLVDGKRVELSSWTGSASSVVYTAKHFRELLDELRSQLDLRYEMLLGDRRKQVERGDGYGLHLLAVDELAYFTAGGTKADREAIVEGLRDYVSRGRAAGMLAVCATQRPSADVVPTQLRDVIGMRWALRCATPASSDMILGAGTAATGFSASKIDAAMRGVGILKAEGTAPRRLRSFLLTEAEEAQIALRAELLRAAV